MTLTVAINGTGVLTNAEAADLGSFNTITIGAETTETDFFLQGSACVSAQASKKAGELYYDVATDFGRALDFDTGGADVGQLLFMWIGCTTLGALESLANVGLTIRLYTDGSNYSDYVIAGYDDLRNFRDKKGGFVCFALDPTLPGDETGASYDYGNINWIGVHIETTASSKTQNIMIDTIAVGYGIQVTGTDTNGWADMADYCTDYGTRAWGMLQYDDSGKIIYSMGKITIGDSGQTAITSLTDLDRNIQFIRTQYYYNAQWNPMVPDDYLGIDFEDAAGFATTYTDGVIVGTEAGRNGSTIEGNLDVSCYFDCSNLVNASSLIQLYCSKFYGIDGYISFKNDADFDIFSCVFNNCEEVDFGGSNPVIRNCIFSNTASSNGAILWYTDLDIENCRFINNGYAVRHTLSEEEDYTSLLFDGNTKDVYYTAASGDLTINLLGTPRSDASTFTATGTGTVYFVAAVTYELTNLIANSNIVLIDQDDESIIDEVENSGTSYQYNYNYGGDIDIYVVVMHINYGYIRFADVLDENNKSQKIFQQYDRWYSNPS